MAVIDIEKIKTQDEVILEVRKIKDDLARAFSYDIKKMLAVARMRQKASCRTVVAPPARKDA
jgi:hypothetical protein